MGTATSRGCGICGIGTTIPRRGSLPSRIRSGSPGGLNLYGFAGGDPVNFSDPFGLRSCPPDCGVIHAYLSAVFGYIGAAAGATLGAGAGTLVLPGGGTISGGTVGGVVEARAGATFGLAVANVAVGAAELIGGTIAERGMDRAIRVILIGLGLIHPKGPNTVPDNVRPPEQIEQDALPKQGDRGAPGPPKKKKDEGNSN